MVDPLLNTRSVLVIDDIHVRGKWTDILLGLIKQILLYKKRQPLKSTGSFQQQNERGQNSTSSQNSLKVILCVSPTCLQLVDMLIDFFSDSSSSNNTHQQPLSTGVVLLDNHNTRLAPVDTYYLDKPTNNYMDQAISTLMTIFRDTYLKQNRGGDVLIFMPTKKDVTQFIRNAGNEIHNLSEFKKLSDPPTVFFFPFHDKLTTEEKLELHNNEYFSEGNTWRIIIATSIAENDYALLATGRLCCVIDSGFDKVELSSISTHALRLKPISQSKADIRRSMASHSTQGRIGKCFRLYRHDYAVNAMQSSDDPELLLLRGGEQNNVTMASGFAEILLRLLFFQIQNIATGFEFLPPVILAFGEKESSRESLKSIDNALLHLFFMGCANSEGQLTRIGRLVVQLKGVPIPFARAIIASSAAEVESSTENLDQSESGGGCLYEMVTITAMFLAGGPSSIFFEPSSKQEREQAYKEHGKFQAVEGDAITLLNVYEAYLRQGGGSANGVSRWAANKYLNYRTLLRAEGIRTQLVNDVTRLGIANNSSGRGFKKNAENISERLCRSICKGFFLNAAKKTYSSPSFEHESNHWTGYKSGGKADTGIRYELLNESNSTEGKVLVKPHQSSVGSNPEIGTDKPWVVYTNLREHNNNEWYIEGITVVKREWLASSNFYQEILPK